jgi:1-acyl-sn-glycerol-3-phosphate acyltransferase
MIRNILFQVAYWVTSALFAVLAVPLLLLPARRPMSAWIRLYSKLMRFWMRVIAGVRVEVKGRERAPEGPFIVAAKHQSWGDGFIMVSEFPDLAMVVGDHLEKFPIVGGILRKMGAIIVDNCGGAHARARLVDEDLKKAAADNRSILIYPEGHLSPVGERHRYRRGVFHMYEAYGRPALPVATNLGLFWPQQSWKLTPGVATVEFLPAIEPGLGKDAFMALLEERIETASLALLGDRAPQGGYLARAPLPDPA